MGRMNLTLAAFVWFSSHLFADDALLLKQIVEQQAIALEGVESIALDVSEITTVSRPEKVKDVEIRAENYVYCLWHPKSGKSLLRQYSNSGTHSSPLHLKKPHTLFDSLEFDGEGFKQVFESHSVLPETKVERVENGIRFTCMLNKNSATRKSWLSYTFDERYSYLPTIIEHRVGPAFESARLSSRETREFARFNNVLYPKLIEKHRYDDRGEIAYTFQARVSRIAANLESHQAITNASQLTEVELFGTPSPTQENKTSRADEIQLKVDRNVQQDVNVGDRINVVLSGELSRKCVELVGLNPPKEDFGCSFICTVERELSVDQVELKGYRVFSNHGKKLNDDDNRRMLSIAATIPRKDVRAPINGISSSDPRPAAQKAEVAKMPLVHLTSLSSAKISSWAQVDETAGLTK